jgi:hypothetical protein
MENTDRRIAGDLKENTSTGKTYRRLGIFCLVLIITYIVVLNYSKQRIDDFCSAINTGMKISQLQTIATENGVSLVGPFEVERDGKKFLYAKASSLMTVGEYACRITGSIETQQVIKVELGTK